MKHFIEIPVDGDVHFVNVNQIVSVQKSGNGSCLYLVNGSIVTELSYDEVKSLIMGV